MPGSLLGALDQLTYHSHASAKKINIPSTEQSRELSINKQENFQNSQSSSKCHYQNSIKDLQR